jgi:hypothetical protein
VNIAEFLEARIEEDEARAGSGWSTLRDTRWETDNYGRNFLTPSAVLAECKAKRVLIEDWKRVTVEHRRAYYVDPPLAPVVAAFAAVYKDHPDYQQEWGQ